MSTVREIYEYIDSIAPFHTQEDWDNSGMLVGDIDKEVSSAAVVLDVTLSAVRTAKKLGADLIISHHPVIFKAQKSFKKGNIAYELAANEISAICAHTNLDAAVGGVNDVLAEKLELVEVAPVSFDGGNVPLLRMGMVDGPAVPVEDFAKFVKDKLGCTAVRYSVGKNEIKNVVVCGGSGCSLIDEAVSLEADAFVTGDASHHDFLNAADAGITLIAAGHFNTEDIVIEPFAKKIAAKFGDIKVIRLKQKDPILYKI